MRSHDQLAFPQQRLAWQTRDLRSGWMSAASLTTTGRRLADHRQSRRARLARRIAAPLAQLRTGTAAELRAEIIADYSAMPVPRGVMNEPRFRRSDWHH
jgi:hypothetical protein